MVNNRSLQRRPDKNFCVFMKVLEFQALSGLYSRPVALKMSFAHPAWSNQLEPWNRKVNNTEIHHVLHQTPPTTPLSPQPSISSTRPPPCAPPCPPPHPPPFLASTPSPRPQNDEVVLIRANWFAGISNWFNGWSWKVLIGFGHGFVGIYWLLC